MELQALLVLCGLGVAGAAVVLLMGLFSASGTSYEEAIAQQRRATTELLALAENKTKPKKKEKKAIKKLAKKERNKENTATATASEQESEAPAESGVDEDAVPATKPHVEFSPPVVVDVPVDTPPNVKIRKRSKDTKVKPILINKDDPSVISDPSTPTPTISNRFEEMHPKDELELLQSSLATEKIAEKKEEVIEKKDIKIAKLQAKGKVTSKSVPLDKEDAARERRNSGDVQAPAGAPKEQRKGKRAEKKPVTEEKAEVLPEPAPVIVQPVSEAPVEKPVQKQVAPTVTASPAAKGKKKKNEPNVMSLIVSDAGGVNVSDVVRVVREAALSRTELQQLTDALLNMHHDQLPEHSEWTEGPNDPIQKLKKQLADKEKALADEIEASQAIHAKLKELRATLNAERGRAAAASAAARAELHTLQARLQRLLDDNHALAQEKLMLQTKLTAEGEAQAQHEAALVQQLAALQAELSARMLELSQARCEAAAARDSVMQHAADCAQQIQEVNRVCSELEQQRQMAVHAEQIAQQELRQAQERLAAMSDLQNEVQRLTSRLQSAESTVEKVKEEAENQKKQLMDEVASLREQLALREAECAELKQMKITPAQNGLPPVSDQYKAAELAKVESVVESMRAELTAAQRSSREQREQLASLNEQLAQYKEKNNELRTKNWKVMEALQSTEKALQMKSTSAIPAQDSLRDAIVKAQEGQFKDIANILRTVCPTAAPNSTINRKWLEVFAENLKKELAKKSVLEEKETVKVPDSRVDKLTEQNEHLQALVDKYKGIIEDTEGVLSRLHQNVTTEEQRWALQLAEKQKELDEFKQNTILQMNKKIESLQLELQQLKSTSRTSASTMLIDSELHRFNGPTQVGVEDK